MKKLIGLITTLNINIGDEFIRDGIIVALEKSFPKYNFEYLMVHKHDPFKFYNWGKYFEFIKRGRIRLARWAGQSTIFENCDAIIQCGAPIFWETCADENTWQNHLWFKVLNRYRGDKPILNLAGGSSYAAYPQIVSDHTPSSVEEKYIKYILNLANKTTVRDKLAHKIATKYDVGTPLIPCSAFIANKKYDIQKKPKDGYIIINYMEIGGHYDYGKTVDSKKWKEELLKIIGKFTTDGHKIVFLCHTEEEKLIAQTLSTKHDILHPTSREDYIKIAMGANFGICNRMHCAIVLGSVGVPAIAVGNDTRLLMVEQIGLPVYSVGNMDANVLYKKSIEIMDKRGFIADKLADLQDKTLSEYIQVIRRNLPF